MIEILTYIPESENHLLIEIGVYLKLIMTINFGNLSMSYPNLLFFSSKVLVFFYSIRV
jgi:hypothetical protein